MDPSLKTVAPKAVGTQGDVNTLQEDGFARVFFLAGGPSVSHSVLSAL